MSQAQPAARTTWRTGECLFHLGITSSPCCSCCLSALALGSLPARPDSVNSFARAHLASPTLSTELLESERLCDSNPSMVVSGRCHVRVGWWLAMVVRASVTFLIFMVQATKLIVFLTVLSFLFCNVLSFHSFWLCWVFTAVCEPFSSCSERGLLSRCGVLASH